MKKVISVFLAALMLMSCLAVVGFAAEKTCTCGVGVHVDGEPCACCVYCPNPNKSKWNACYSPAKDSYCCADCTGMYGCTCKCGCEHCKTGNQDIAGDNNTLDKVVDDQTKGELVSGFQGLLKKVSDFFDKIFDAIFEFLRIDEVLGNGSEA